MISILFNTHILTKKEPVAVTVLGCFFFCFFFKHSKQFSAEDSRFKDFYGECSLFEFQLNFYTLHMFHCKHTITPVMSTISLFFQW